MIFFKVSPRDPTAEFAQTVSQRRQPTKVGVAAEETTASTPELLDWDIIVMR